MSNTAPPAIPARDPVAPDVARVPASISTRLAANVDVLLRLGLLGIILVVAAFFAVRTIPSGQLSDIGQATFISQGNLEDIGRQMAVVGVIAIGETFVIITAGIDLSVGSLIGISGVLAASAFLSGWSTPVVIVAILLFALAIGLVNGFLVAKARIPPFIVTLGMLGVLRGAAYLTANGQNQALSATGEPTPFSNWAGSLIFSFGSFQGVPTIFVVLLVLGVIGEIFLRATRRGRYVYAIGSNPEAARLAGVNTTAILLMVYAISAVLAGVAGLLLTGRLNGANPNAGTSYELDAIAAAVLGGASLFGARGSIAGTFLGVLLVNVLANGIDLINMEAHVQQVVEGALLVVIVWVDQWRKRRLAAG